MHHYNCKTLVILMGILLISSSLLSQCLENHDNSECWTQTVCESSIREESHPMNSTFKHGPFSVTHSTLMQEKGCHPWMFYNRTSEECECSDIPYRAVLCDPTIPMTSILDCYCMTYNAEQNETELGRCLFGCGHKVDTVYYKLPQSKTHLNSYTCININRDSTLCGKCMPGYSPLVYSYDMKCMNCTGMTYNWIKYVAIAYIPLTFLYFVVVMFRFSGTSPLLRGFITCSQGLLSPISIRAIFTVAKGKSYLEIFLKVIGTINGIWNLDFFRLVLPPICLEISSLQALALDYAIAFYPFVLVIITYILISLHSRDVCIVVWLWKPFHKMFHLVRKDWDLEGSLVQAFATLFMISYLKILNVSLDLLIYTSVYTLPVGEQHYQVKHALYYDASVEYFKGDHLYYGITAILVGTLIIILPLLFLVIYPMHWFQNSLNYFRLQRQGIDMFVNCYQGYYKDGTNGTRDYRCFSIAFFLIQIIVFILFTLSKSIYSFSLGALVILFFMFATLTVQPYKEQFKAYNKIDAFIYLVFGGVFIMATASDEAVIKDSEFTALSYTLMALMGALLFIYQIALIIWWIFVKNNFKKKLLCFRKYEPIQLEESSHSDDIPDRVKHPFSYGTQSVAAPLLSVSYENECNQK